MKVFTKTCRRCGETKNAEHLKRDTRNRDGYSSFCKTCHQASSVAWQRANPERLNASRRERYARNAEVIRAKRRAAYRAANVRQPNVKRNYRITPAQYGALLAQQNGCCALCGAHHSKFKRALAVDHAHACCPKTPTCGRCTRGLLCHPCNTALHAIEKNVSWLRNVQQYLGRTP